MGLKAVASEGTVAPPVSGGTGNANGIAAMMNSIGGVPVANESMYPFQTWTGSQQVFSYNSRKSYNTNRATGFVRLVYFVPSTSIQSVAITQQHATRAAVEYPSGVFTPVFFKGKRTGVADAQGGLLVSDPVTVGIPAGAQFWVRTYNSSPTNIYVGVSCNSAAGENSDAAFNTGQADKTLSGTITGTSGNICPLVITGDLGNNLPIVGLAGDSIMSGTGDYLPGTGTNLTNYGQGFGRRAMQSTVPFINVAIYGQTFGSYPSGRLNENLRLLQACTHIIDDTGINDVSNSVSAATLEQEIINTGLLLAAAHPGVQIFRTTLTPHTSSTDNWATVVNQSVLSTEPVRLAVNTWIRGGMPVGAVSFVPVAVGTAGALLAGQNGHPYQAQYFDTEAAVSALNGSAVVWSPGNVWTVDSNGLHPSAAGHAAMAAIIAPTALTWVA